MGMDNYYIVLKFLKQGLSDPSLAKDHNFDDPKSLDFDLMYKHVV